VSDSAKLLPTIDDVHQAARFIARHVERTPALHSYALDSIAGCELWLKAENLQRVGAFKVRGAINAMGRLDATERARGVVTFSSGNHAQAVAYAARVHGCPATVAMPTDAPRIKVAAVKAMGAEVIFAGTTSDDRKVVALEVAERTGAAVIQPFDHPHIIAGQGTATLELLEQTAQLGVKLDAIVVPVGGGGLIAGACLVAAAHDVAVISSEPAVCDALAKSLEAGERVVVQPGDTIADGLKPTMIGELNFAIAKQHVAASLRVDDEQIGRALVTLAVTAKSVVEPSGATALAGVLAHDIAALVPALAGRRAPLRVGVVLSGGNIAAERVAQMLSHYRPHPRKW